MLVVVFRDQPSGLLGSRTRAHNYPPSCKAVWLVIRGCGHDPQLTQAPARAERPGGWQQSGEPFCWGARGDRGAPPPDLLAPGPRPSDVLAPAFALTAVRARPLHLSRQVTQLHRERGGPAARGYSMWVASPVAR